MDQAILKMLWKRVEAALNSPTRCSTGIQNPSDGSIVFCGIYKKDWAEYPELWGLTGVRVYKSGNTYHEYVDPEEEQMVEAL